MKWLIVNPSYVRRQDVVVTFKDDARRANMKMKVILCEEKGVGWWDIRIEGNAKGCGYWSANLPDMGRIIDDQDIPEELFEL